MIMSQVKLTKPDQSKLHRFMLMVMVVGLTVVIGLWLLQLQATFSREFVADFQGNFDDTIAEIQAAADYGAELEEFTAFANTNVNDLFGTLDDFVQSEVAKQQVLNAVAAEIGQVEDAENTIGGEPLLPLEYEEVSGEVIGEDGEVIRETEEVIINETELES